MSSARRVCRRRPSTTTCMAGADVGRGPGCGWASDPIASRNACRSTRSTPFAAHARRAYYCFCTPGSSTPIPHRRWPPDAADISRDVPPPRSAVSRARVTAGEPAVVRFLVPDNRDVLRGCGSWDRVLPHERHRRSRAGAIGRAPRVQLRRGRGRCADGGDACHPRRRPHFEYAAAAAPVRGVRATRRRYSRTSRWCAGRITARSRSGTARRRWRSSARRAICRKRSSTTWRSSAGRRGRTRSCCQQRSSRRDSGSLTWDTARACSTRTSSRGSTDTT